MSAAEVFFIKAEIANLGISGSMMDIEENLRRGIEHSYLLWLQLHDNTTNNYNPIWRYTYPALKEAIDNSDLYSLSSSYASQIMNKMIYMNPEFTYTPEDFQKVIHQQRWLDLFRQPGEAWSLARRSMDTPTTTDHKKLTSFRMPYPPTEVTYNYDNYKEQVAKMPEGDTRSSKVWWMTK